MFKDHRGDKNFLVHGLYVWKIWIFSQKLCHILTVDGSWQNCSQARGSELSSALLLTNNLLSRSILWGVHYSIQQYRATTRSWLGTIPKQIRNQKKSSSSVGTDIPDMPEFLWQEDQCILKLGEIHGIAIWGLLFLWIAILTYPSPTIARTNHWTTAVGRVLTKELEATGYLTVQCQAMLVILGGVETNPGPTQEKQREVIETLVSTAREYDVKNVLRSYNLTHIHKQQVRDISKHNINKLKGAALFLKIEGTQSLLKPALVQAVIVRIQNLLPDKCRICDEEYTVLLEEKPLLECSICGQGAHLTL